MSQTIMEIDSELSSCTFASIPSEYSILCSTFHVHNEVLWEYDMKVTIEIFIELLILVATFLFN